MKCISEICYTHFGGRFRNLERGVQPLAHEENFWVATLTSGHMNAFMTHAHVIIVALTGS